MKKLANPFGGDKTVYITQTYHSGGGNIAIDCITSNTTSQTPVYAISDGIVMAATPAGNSYLCKSVDGANFQEFYVHTARWTVKAGDRVKAGDMIGYIATPQENGGFPMHLHMGLTVGNYIMDYFGRGINFRTTYQDIANDWFSGSIHNPINWSLFKDLSLDDGEMFSVGDRIVFTGEQNIRVGSGLKYDIESSTYAGMKATIIGGPRTADGYTWYNIQVDGGGTGWIADVNKFTHYTEDESGSNDSGSSDNSSSNTELENLRKKLNETQDELDRVQVQMYEYRDKADKYFQLYQKVDIENNRLYDEAEQLSKYSKEQSAQIKELSEWLEDDSKTISALEEKLAEQLAKSGSIDNYTTAELLREIVRRVFSAKS